MYKTKYRKTVLSDVNSISKMKQKSLLYSTAT